MTRWYLEGYFQNDRDKSQQPLATFPQSLGRDESLSCVLSAASVSRRHATIEEREGALWLVDLGSRNGTFVNRKAISQATPIGHGDVIHIGTVEVRLIDSKHSNVSRAHDIDEGAEETRFISTSQLSENFPSGVRELEKLIADEAVAMVFQPIIVASDLSTCGYEILGRGASKDLPTSPLDLFRIAESFGLQVELSDLMRNKGVAVAVAHNLKGDLLVNTHPSELMDPDRLLASLTALRHRYPLTPLTLEIHEQSVTGDRDLLRSLKKKLDTLSIKLAFDDFGVGQSRLMEMVEAKPSLIKFDRVLIDRIHEADPSRVNLLRHLQQLAAELCIQTLAECVSSAGEYGVCKTMGFDYYQGFYFAKPQPAENFAQLPGTL